MTHYMDGPSCDDTVMKVLQPINGSAREPRVYCLFVTALLLIAALALAPAWTHAEDETLDRPASAQADKKTAEDVDLFLKGLNDATDEDARLAQANSESPKTIAKMTQASLKTKKQTHAQREKGEKP